METLLSIFLFMSIPDIAFAPVAVEQRTHVLRPIHSNPDVAILSVIALRYCCVRRRQVIRIASIREFKRVCHHRCVSESLAFQVSRVSTSGKPKLKRYNLR